mgnify:CR=1 FL=1|nr:MAG TPA: abortive infection protein [Caudoviricetes sp.]
MKKFFLPVKNILKKLLSSTFVHLIILTLVSLALWFWGVYSFQLPAIPQLSFIAEAMGQLDNRENLFAPIGTFFSGLSAIATAYLIWLQQKTMRDHDREVDTDRAITHFFSLLELHRTILNHLKYPADIPNTAANNDPNTEYIYSYNAIEYYIMTLQCSITLFCKEHTKAHVEINKISKIISRYLRVFRYGDSKNISFDRAIEIAFEAINHSTEYCLEQYFHNIYIMLKLLDENRNNLNINEYLRTLRAELTQNEFILIYYHAYNHKHHGTNEKKFKELIERTCFFHSLHKTTFDIDPATRKSFVLYEPSAFDHK